MERDWTGREGCSVHHCTGIRRPPLVFSFYDTVDIKHFLRASVLAVLSVVVADPWPCVNLISYKTIQTSAAGVIYTCTGVAVRIGPGVTRRRQGRPRPHLHADDPGSNRRHVGLRSYRRRSLARLRRIRVQGTRHQDQPRRGIAPQSRISSNCANIICG